MTNPSRSIIEKLRKDFPKGCRVKLVHMDDDHAPVKGTLGTVICVDDIGTIHVEWDNGSTLGVAYGKDSCVVVS